MMHRYRYDSTGEEFESPYNDINYAVLYYDIALHCRSRDEALGYLRHVVLFKNATVATYTTVTKLTKDSLT